MAIRQADVLTALRQVQDPDLHRDVVSLNMIKDLTVEEGKVALRLVLTGLLGMDRDEVRHLADAGVLA